jgi:NAD+ synthase
MTNQEKITFIVEWLKSYSEKSRTQGFVVGVSGGIDSALTSTLCAMTGKKTLLLEMPIYQAMSQVTRAQEHITWLRSKYDWVMDERVELTSTFDQLLAALPEPQDAAHLNLALANTRSRLRMTTLYYFAGLHGLLVAGTGNKIEDFGVGFFTKYGDGGVDLSPIADLTKTEVYELAQELGVNQSILIAPPTDGLWGDDRTDEDQIGASYPELEWAMDFIEQWTAEHSQTWQGGNENQEKIAAREKEVLAIYWRMHSANQHKMEPIPVCLLLRKK